MKLSIAMMVKNEERYIEDCLNALIPILENLDSELIIVDTGSNDRTVEIAQKFTDKVYLHKWNNNFSEMRNITLSYCSGEWFFYVDGDEVMENWEDIIHFFKSGEYKKYNTASICIKNLINLDDMNNYGIFTANRLFKRDEDFIFLGAIHNQPQWKNPVKHLKASCMHYGYISTDKELMERKYQRTATILRQELEKDPTNVYYMYQLSVSLGMHNDYKEATEQIQKTYDYIKEENIDINQYFYVLPHMCVCYITEKEYEKTKIYAKECLNYRKDYIDAYFYLGCAQFALQEYEEAAKNLEMHVKLAENYDNLIKDTGTVYYTIVKLNDSYFYLSLIYNKLMNLDKEIYYLSKVKGKKYDVSDRIIDITIKNKTYDKLLEYTNILIDQEEYDKLEGLYLLIESKKLQIDYNENNEITGVFSNSANPYGKLNSIRMKYVNKDMDLVESAKNLLSSIKIEECKDYYGDLLYYLIECKEDISKFVDGVPKSAINDFLQYMHIKYNDFLNVIYEYIEVYGENDDFISTRVNMILCRHYLLLNKSEKERFEEVFLMYLDIGIKYVNEVYSSFILENEKYLEAKNEEEGFFIFIRKAAEYEGRDNKLFLQYIRKALEIYPYMKEGIEFILEKFKREIEDPNYEFEKYKIKVKKTLKELINSGNFEGAKNIIDEYENIVSNDMEMILFKSEIALKQIDNKSSVKH